MAEFAPLLFRGKFACGMAHYQDCYSAQERPARIVLTVTVRNFHSVPVIVDTGAPWCILDPELVRELGVKPESGYGPGEPLRIGETRYEGWMVRVPFTLVAEQGNSLAVEATVFVPILHTGQTWNRPNFIGLQGFLDRIRFAVDPAENAFYFGPIWDGEQESCRDRLESLSCIVCSPA